MGCKHSGEARSSPAVLIHMAHIPWFCKVQKGRERVAGALTSCPTHSHAALTVVAGKTTLAISFMLKGFPYKHYRLKSYYCNGLILCIANTLTSSTLSLFSVFSYIILLKAQYCLFCAAVAVKLQSIDHLWR